MAAKMSCLVVCSSAPQGVSAQSFMHAFTLTNTVFNVQIATPKGQQIDFVKIDECSRKWLNEFRTKPFSVPGKLENVDAARYSSVLIPGAPGALHDLVKDKELGKLLNTFVKEKKPICAIGFGVVGLCSAHNDSGGTWNFKEYSMTAPSVYELARSPEFSSLPVIPEDYIKDHGGSYSHASESNCVHVIIDRHLITGQNDQSTVLAVQNLILLCNARCGIRIMCGYWGWDMPPQVCAAYKELSNMKQDKENLEVDLKQGKDWVTPQKIQRIFEHNELYFQGTNAPGQAFKIIKLS